MSASRKTIPGETTYRKHGRYEIPDRRASGAESFYLRNLLVPSTRIERLVIDAARHLPQLTTLLFKSQKDGKLQTDLVEEIRLVSEYLSNAGVAEFGRVSVLGLRDYSHSTRRQAVLFFFGEMGESPIAIATCRTATDAGALEREFAALQHLKRTLPVEISRTVPDPMAFFQTGRGSVLLESALAGSSIYFQMRNMPVTARRIEEHFEAAFRWLLKFHRSTVRHSLKLEDLFRRDWPEDFAEEEEFSRDARIKTDSLEEDAVRLGAEVIPVAAVQGDFWTRNILTDGRSVGVVDWEDYTSEGAPMDDAFMFCISYGRGFQWRSGRWLDAEMAFRKTFFEQNPVSSTVRRHLVNFSQELGISGEVLHLLFGAFLAGRTANAARAIKAVTDKEVLVWRSLFQAYATAGKSAFFG